MPLIQVSLASGRTPEQLQALGQALTEATATALSADPTSVRVILTECEPEHWFAGGRTLADRRATG